VRRRDLRAGRGPIGPGQARSQTWIEEVVRLIVAAD